MGPSIGQMSAGSFDDSIICLLHLVTALYSSDSLYAYYMSGGIVDYLKAEKQEGVAYRELLANLYQHLLEEYLTAGAADMNRPNYCPVNSSTQVAGQFPSQAYLFVYIISWGRLAQCPLKVTFMPSTSSPL